MLCRDTYRIFYIAVNFAFNLPHLLLAISTTQAKKIVKRDFKTRKKNKVMKNSLKGDSNPDPLSTRPPSVAKR